jgi:hypothetical protein
VLQGWAANRRGVRTGCIELGYRRLTGPTFGLRLSLRNDANRPRVIAWTQRNRYHCDVGWLPRGILRALAKTPLAITVDGAKGNEG